MFYKVHLMQNNAKKWEQCGNNVDYFYYLCSITNTQ